ncbi:hypothetical protein BDP27DRAFT_1288896 [Rhodocollybia butyracea]|uniref:C2H2-type domain-containing protein n=1 Tax=Rhodocollybia butyracea TaxID=206335 RepID=A0A9P5PVZ5_9AGAR|nr:hypothetical protein BDP27DRAFT_1288896 [Rhodocollybia butyracea]
MLTTETVLGKRKTSEFVLHLEAPVIINGTLTTGNTKKLYQCTVLGCEKAYTKPSRLEEHTRSHTGVRPFVCTTCQKSYFRENHLQAHARTHLPASDKSFICTESSCDKRFWTSQHLRTHLDWHNGAKTFQCTEPECTKVFNKHHLLKSHFSTDHDTKLRPYPCSHEGCTKSFDTNQHLRTHTKVHNEKRYTCVHEACMPTTERPIIFYPNWTALQNHIRTDHPPTCTHPSCNKRVFASQKGLRAHQKLHEQRDDEAQLSAAIRDEEAIESEQPLKKRRRGGDYGRDWKCQVDGCTKDFKSASNDKALGVHHKVTHEGKRDFVCPTCDAAFGYKHLLQRHVARLHDGVAVDESSSSESDSDPPLKPNLDIGTITGTTYADRATEPKAIRCPFPHLNDITFTLCGDTPGVLDCAYVFRRAYDLRRHLLAIHKVEASKSSIDTWVQSYKSTNIV